MENAKTLNTFDRGTFHKETEKNIDKYALEEEKERLKIIVKMETLEIDEINILKDLQNEEKLYLLIFCNIKKKQNENGEKLKEIMKIIGSNIKNGEYCLEVL